MKRLILLALTVMLACQTASAVGFDIRGGANVSGMTFLPVGQSQLSLSPRIGYYAGANVDFDIWKGLFVETGAGIVSRGARDHDMYADYFMNYVEVPLSVGYRFVLDNNLSVYVDLGGWGAYGAFGNVRTEGKVYGCFGEFAKPLDAGLHAGFGAVIYGHIQFGFKYSYGLLNIATESTASTLGNLYNNGMCFQLGWRF